jgi:hypothetical protein
MRALVQVEIRCKEHERFDPVCPLCCFLKKAEHDLEAVRNRRDSLVQQIKQRLTRKDLLIIDIR